MTRHVVITRTPECFGKAFALCTFAFALIDLDMGAAWCICLKFAVEGFNKEGLAV